MGIDLRVQDNKSRQIEHQGAATGARDGYRLGSVPACFNSAPLM